MLVLGTTGLLGCKRPTKTTTNSEPPPNSSNGSGNSELRFLGGKNAATLRVGSKTIALAARGNATVAVEPGDVRVTATAGGETFELDLAVADGERILVPIAPEQCFARVEPKEKKVIERQPVAMPLKLEVDALGLDEASRSRAKTTAHVGQFPCRDGAVADDVLYEQVVRGVAWDAVK